jgi:hypothetical protein
MKIQLADDYDRVSLARTTVPLLLLSKCIKVIIPMFDFSIV